MRNLITLGFSCLLAGHALAAGPSTILPSAPESCATDIADHGYCTETTFPAGGFPFAIRFWVVVEKEAYPTVESLLDKYMNFELWPDYVTSVGEDTIVFNKSVRFTDKLADDGSVIARHYYDYKLKSPIGYQKIRGVTHNHRLPVAYLGSDATIEFQAQTAGPQEVPPGEKPLVGAEGVKSQQGVINALSCQGSNLCADTQRLLVYETTITPSISLLPKVAASAVQKGLETVLVGMLFNNVP